jgi:hypothetical protein
MKMRSLLLLLVLLSMNFGFAPDPCDSLLFFKEGTKTTITSFNDDGKVTGSTKTVYKKVDKSGATTSVSATQENYDKKGKLSVTTDFIIKCINGSLFFDMKLMMPQQQAESFKDFEMVVDGVDKEIPTELVAGSSLKDAEVKFSFKTKDGTIMPMMNMSVWITNRKVVGQEKVTTPAGTFECYKMTEDVEMKTLFKIKVKTTSWFSKEAGIVKTESYKENGKLVGKTELTEISK